MYIRFVIAKRDERSGRRQGLFYAAYELADRGGLSADDLADLDEIHEWFAKNMSEPTRASWSTRPHAKGQALSWFKESATSHVSRMRALQALLSEYGVFADTLRTARPGPARCSADRQADVPYLFLTSRSANEKLPNVDRCLQRLPVSR
jgi:hypothetical protein